MVAVFKSQGNFSSHQHLHCMEVTLCQKLPLSYAAVHQRPRSCASMPSDLETHAPGAPLTYFNDGGGGGVRQRFIFYTQKNPKFRICLPKKIPSLFSIPKKIPQCFLHQQILLFIFWKAKTNRLQSQKYPVIPHKQ